MAVFTLKDALNPRKNYKLRGGEYGEILAKITTNSGRNEVLLKIVKHLIGETLQEGLVFTTTRDTTLVLHVASSAWATRIRFAGPELLTHLRQLSEYQALDDVHVVVNPLD